MKKIIKCFVKFVTLTALFHILFLIIKTIKDGNVKNLNYFRILDLDFLFPKITHGLLSDILSLTLMLSIFGVFLFFSFQKKQ